MAALYSHTTRATGLTLTAAIYNSDHQNHIDNGVPLQQDDYSTNVAQMQVTADPGEVGTESLATTQAGELERLRFAIRELKGTDQWYESIVAMQGSTTGLTIGSNSVNPDGTLHVHTATAGAVAAVANADDLVVENNADGGMSFLVPNGNDITIAFGDVADSDVGRIRYLSTNDMLFFTNAAERVRIDPNGTLFIGDTVNANMTQGLTINQGANDDEALAAKSSDVAHAMTGIAEADTYGTLGKSEATSGGLFIRGLKDADGIAGRALDLQGILGEAADTTDTSTSDSVIRVSASVTDGGTSSTAVADAGNIFGIENDGTLRAVFKGDGAFHITNVVDVTGAGNAATAIALDGEDDVGLVRVHQRTIHNDMGIAMSKWDESIHANADDLKRVGVLSSEGDFTNVQRMNSLLGGAIWQMHTRFMELQERLETTERKLALLAN